MDALASLLLQIEWGADEALEDSPVDRRLPDPAPHPAPSPARSPAAAFALPPPRSDGEAAARVLAEAARSVAELEQALTGFDGCVLRSTATNLVFGAGEPNAALMLVEGVPCAPEDRHGVPFAGAPGQFLDRMLASAGLGRGDARTASLLPWRPPGDRKPTEAEVALCLPFLQRHIALVRPRFVLLFGALAAKTLLPGPARRGRPAWQDLAVPGLDAPVPALALPTTLHIQKTPSAKRDAWGALLLLKRAMQPG